jgi:hypothetical protein
MRYLLVVTVLMCAGCASDFQQRLARGFTAAGSVELPESSDPEPSKTIYNSSGVTGRIQGDSVYYSDGSMGSVR